MAKPPAGPIGNSPRDMRDDAVGVPADDINTGEPPRWPPKPKKITSNTFHAKVSGGATGKRADRKPHFRKGGFVKGYAAGGPVESKNDPGDLGKKGLKKGGPVGSAGRFREGGKVKLAEGGKVEKPPSLPISSGTLGRPPLRETVPSRLPQTGSYSMGEGSYRKIPRFEEKSGGSVPKYDEGGKVPKMPKPRPLPKEPSNPVGPRDLGEPMNPIGPERDIRDIGEPPPRSFPVGPPLGEKFKDGGKLSAAQRQSLPKSDFALPGQGKGPKGAGSGSYPIPDESHAKNALARSSGKPEAATVRAKVKAKYPDMGEK